MGEKIVPDSSILIEGKISEYIANGKLDLSEIIIPHAALDELQAQASRGQEVGFLGLEELKKIQVLGESKGFSVRFVGERPSFEDIKLARSGRIDALIIDVAKNEDGTLLTGDYVQSLVAQAKGVKVLHIAVEVKTTGLAFETLFSPDTLSIHLKQGVPPMAKQGKPGNFHLVKIKDEPCPAEELEDIVKQIFEATRVSNVGFIEISRSGASVVQLG
ncbi:MAG: PIN domain-containing protein, partial [Candidatus Bathyarchaeia archaeon]